MSDAAAASPPLESVHVDRLTTTLSLLVEGATFEISAGNLERFDVVATVWGFDATCVFVQYAESDEDSIAAKFQTTKPITATLAFTKFDPDADKESPPFRVTGVVHSRRVQEIADDKLDGEPVVIRRYTLSFVDVAAAYWKTHHPVALYTDASMHSVLEKHRPGGFEITYALTALESKQSIFFLPLATDFGVSFYDFVAWWVESNDGVFEYDPAKDKYRIGDRYSKPPGQPIALDPEDVERIEVDMIVPSRASVTVLNGWTESASARTPIENGDGVTKIVREVLLRTELGAVVDARVATEKARLFSHEHAIAAHFRRCPPKMLAPLARIVVKEGFSPKSYPYGKPYRVRTVSFRASQSLAHPHRPDDEHVVYVFEMSVTADHERSAYRPVPHYREPPYPLLIEGRVVSASGGDTDRTWFASGDKKTGIENQIVRIPLFNLKVPIRHEPGLTPGHFFFPSYKEQRVLLAFEFDEARIDRYLDWADNVRVPLDAQGDQIVLGYGAKNGTYVRHVYNDKKPEFTIKRTMGPDTETWLVHEGAMFLEVKEEKNEKAEEPKFDLSAKAAAATEEIKGTVGTAITDARGNFQTKFGAASGALDSASAELDSKLTGTEEKLGGKLDNVEGELGTMRDKAGAAAGELVGAISDAKGALKKLLDDD